MSLDSGPPHKTENEAKDYGTMTKDLKELDEFVEDETLNLEIKKSAEQKDAQDTYTDIDGVQTDTVPNPNIAAEPKGPTFYLLVIANLFIWTFPGAAIRMSIEGSPVESKMPYLWPQFLGTLVIAYMATHKQRIINSLGPEVFTGISTGFCGSLTTFSSWMAAPAEFVFNQEHRTAPEDRISTDSIVYSYFDFIFVGLAFPLMGWGFGVHLADIEMNILMFDFCDSKTFRYEKFRTYSTITFAILLWIMILFLSIYVSDGFFTIGLLFSPFGSLLRWFLGLLLNTKNPDFPIGTFIANILACVILSIAYVLAYELSFETTLSENTKDLYCNIALGIINGFCGCLSTVSTFMLELHTIRRRKWGYIYGVASVIVAQVCVWIIFGTFSAVYAQDHEIFELDLLNNNFYKCG